MKGEFMELDLRYKQYESLTNGTEKKDDVGDDVHEVVKPFQEIIDFFEGSCSKIFSYNSLMKVLKNVHGKQEFTLSNGAKLFINSTSDLVNIGIVYPDKTKFVGCWSNITNDKEFIKKSFEMTQKK